MTTNPTTLTPPSIDQMPTGYHRRRMINRILLYSGMSLIGLIIVVPLLWMFSTSFKPKPQLFSKEIYWIPKIITLENYQKILDNPSTPIAKWFVNSVFVAVLHTGVVLAISTAAAYAYARLEFPGRKLLFGLLLVTLFLPGVMFLVPNFTTITRMKLLDSFAGVLLPGFAAVFPVFFMRQFFESIPKELEEAAQIDGATTLQTFFKIVLPLFKPAIATLTIIESLHSWNDLLWPIQVFKNS